MIDNFLLPNKLCPSYFCPKSGVKVPFAQKAVSKFLLPKKLCHKFLLPRWGEWTRAGNLRCYQYCAITMYKQNATPTDKLKTFIYLLQKRMHSSRMRTGRSLTVCRCLLPQGGVCSGVGVVSQHALRHPPPVNRMTDRCKNITLATTSLRPVNITYLLHIVFAEILSRTTKTKNFKR